MTIQLRLFKPKKIQERDLLPGAYKFKLHEKGKLIKCLGIIDHDTIAFVSLWIGSGLNNYKSMTRKEFYLLLNSDDCIVDEIILSPKKTRSKYSGKTPVCSTLKYAEAFCL